MGEAFLRRLQITPEYLLSHQKIITSHELVGISQVKFSIADDYGLA